MQEKPRLDRIQATAILVTGAIGLLSGLAELFSLWPLLGRF